MLIPAFADETRRLKRAVPLEGVRQTGNKVVRIRRLGGCFGRSQIRFRNSVPNRRLVDQFRDFPLGAFDDDPNALELVTRRLEHLYALR